MEVKRSNLDPRVADLLGQVERRKTTAGFNGWFALGLFIVGTSLFLALAAAAKASVANGEPAIMLLVAATLLGGGIVSLKRGMPGKTQSDLLDVDVLQRIGASRRKSVSRAEKEYCRIIALLMQQDAVDEETNRNLLGSLNELLGCSRALTRQQDKIDAVLKEGSADELRKEQGELEARRNPVLDAVSRSAIEQLIELNAHRQANATAFEQARERLQMQQEVVTQTFASIKSTLLRASLAPGGASPAAPDIATASETIGRINRQARSVEEAVQEVMGMGV